MLAKLWYLVILVQTSLDLNRLRVLYLLCITCCFGQMSLQTVSAEERSLNSSKIDQSYVMALAQSDGSLMTQASFCSFNETINNALADKIGNDFNDLVKNYAINLTLQDWKESFDAGLDTTKELLILLPRSGDNYEKNCIEVAQKLQQRMTKKFD